MEIPKAPECKECGGDPVFHSMTYYTILIDDTLRSLMDPGFVGRFVKKVVDPIERRTTPHIVEFLMNRGWAQKIERPDDDTQLLALMLWQDADTRGIDVVEFRLFTLPRNIFLAKMPNGKKIVYEGIPLPPRSISREPWLDNKAIMKEKFQKVGLPVAKGGAAKTVREAKKIFRNVTPPVIVKPYSGSGSRHTILHISDEEELARAFAIAKQICPAVVVEEELVGPVYRATVVDGKLAATLRRDQPVVIGDGMHSVGELIDVANTHQKRGGPYFHPISITEDTYAELTWQNMTLESVPTRGERATLHQKINWGVGGTTADVTDVVHEDNKVLFERVAEVLKAPMVGIDFIIPDITKSYREQERCGIIECNSMPFFDNHHLPFEGEPRNVAGLIWDMIERG